MNSKISNELQSKVLDYAAKYETKVGAFSYLVKDGQPTVCQMGYSIFMDMLILHTDTNSRKWNSLKSGSHAALTVGANHRQDYILIEGVVRKITNVDDKYEVFESNYFKAHPDSKNYKDYQECGIILLEPIFIRYAEVKGFECRFKEKNLTSDV